ncbi:MAG: hypothetical protein JWO67_4571 [Streptosporangiaceae bacterium]|nr:hypothetical protein [Streptosporangiaceae bacterium]
MSVPTGLTVGDLSARHLGTQVTVLGFVREGRTHCITGVLEDVTHLRSGAMTTLWLREWSAEPPLAQWVASGGHWMVRQEQSIEVADQAL